MVIQQSTRVRLWGESTPRSSVRVLVSWSNETYSTSADSNGDWELFVVTLKGNFDPQTITIRDSTDDVTLKNVLVGEVWLGSGQSNMKMPLDGYDNCPVKNSNKVIAKAGDLKGVRTVNIEYVVEKTPQKYAIGSWLECNANTAPDFSSTPFFFAKALSQVLNCPVGVIRCAWGGSTIEGWLPREILENYTDVNFSMIDDPDILPYNYPMIMYNGLLYPVSKYTIKGFLWYQGESNIGHEDAYPDRLVALVNWWRSLFGYDNYPFYLLEISPYNYSGNGTVGALFREAQFKAQKLIPNSGFISTNDLVEGFEVNQIHPTNKKKVGQRLAFQVLRNTYGYTGIYGDSPTLKNYSFVDNRIDLSFNDAEVGLQPWNDIVGFEIAGDDRVFHPATAVYDQNTMTINLSSISVPTPVAARYCFRDFLIGNVKNHRQLPLVPFRTDDWVDVTPYDTTKLKARLSKAIARDMMKSRK